MLFFIELINTSDAVEPNFHHPWPYKGDRAQQAESLDALGKVEITVSNRPFCGFPTCTMEEQKSTGQGLAAIG
ncbi:MAG: hypothetical protein JGK17_16000 [Microcoleus sp. PH2017_10_PVI_O_A]|uniref:hypothetical protein n=1 Tax=unclassified Microcoleus TaxID=2642155 RepID=UPI001E042BC4|nr:MULTISPECIES: hypothetical protein [unclassified Microcoleus]TAE80391.1 MAG: hypothetical protein EAZ83_18480 [Oscillatoriales cyanobacterium]MCC3407063.1 hypothetical protein [Microcoleus sp. PH2017_10_PVI_O_A]MCC3461835.1 hypothetical protein [Microcoleus sp. PH2017_11_PCY_U_A]MCC3477964.1 hypothetical protein [Microcoleus sp. PH2017_12_PCY_D_A]MCC3529072.1 hypothetical protein [Microcoleus sp. PH2017_21_RUC_O_A]